MRCLFSNAVLLFFIGGGWPVTTCFFPLHAQPMLYSVQAHHALAASIGDNHRHPFSVVVNPASLAGYKKVAWAFGGEQRFLAPGWTSLAAAGVLPAARGSWGFLMAQEGLPAVFDQLMMITHARVVFKQALVGVSLGVNRKRAVSLTSIVAPVAAAGCTFSLSSELQTSLSFTLYTGQRVMYSSSADLTIFRYILGYQPSEKFAMVSGITKETGRAAVGSISVCYRPSYKAGFRIGFSGSPSLCWFGLLLGIGKKVMVQVYSGFYSLVGVSNGMSVFCDPAAAQAEQAIR